jgi:MOSC domain-containing protein YiiM
MTLNSLKEQFAQQGTIHWIGIRPARREALKPVQEAILRADEGLIGDHYSGKNGKRHLTLIQAEHLAAVASMLGKEEVDPAAVRRNVVVKGINLLALKDKKFQLGDCILEFTGLCHPCSRMEEVLGHGGYNAMRGHGGITARVLEGGTIKLGDGLMPMEQQVLKTENE